MRPLATFAFLTFACLASEARSACAAGTTLGVDPAAAPNEAVQRMLTVELAKEEDVATLLAHDFDVIRVHPGGPTSRPRLDLIATDEEIARLDALGYEVRIVHEDLARHYEERLAQPASWSTEGTSLGSWLAPPFGQGSMGGYYTWDEVTSVLDQIAAAYPSIVRGRESIGSSHQGRGIWNVKLSDNPTLDETEPEVRFDAMHHAREPEGMQSTLWALLWLVENYGSDARATWIVDNREIWFRPVVNPDGYVHNQTTTPGGGGLWRKNRRDNGNGSFGVDLNRNYDYEWGFDNTGSSPSTSSETYRGPSAGSEPEVQAMSAFLATRSFATALSVHTFANLWLSPWGYTAAPTGNSGTYAELGAHATEGNAYTVGPFSTALYLGNGVTVDYDQGVHGTLSWTPEIGGDGDGFWPPQSRIVPLAEENLEAFLRTALAAGPYVRALDVTLEDTGNGDGLYDPGEVFEVVVTVRNGGLLATTQGIDIAITNSSPELTPITASTSLGNLNAFTSTSNASVPLSFSIDPGTTSGTPASFDVELTWEGLTETLPIALVVGQPRPFLRDNLEADLGWIAGLPSDTATTGLWVYGDPVGTNYEGEDANPEDDASPSGVNCYTTGNGSTAAGNDDVDNGVTTLLSPLIDLSGVTAAEISYSRWFADFSTFDDPFRVSISDDGGETWVELETVPRTANSWTRASFFVSDYVSLTDEVRLRFVASDEPNNSIVEAAVDDLQVRVYDVDPRFNLFGTPDVGTDVAFHANGPAGASYGVFEASGTGLFSFALINGPLLLDPLTLVLLFQGTIPPAGLARAMLTIPNDPALIGTTLYYQALVSDPSGLFLTNRDELAFQ